jgi:uncharacterized protein GlcG (DUF336 family)
MGEGFRAWVQRADGTAMEKLEMMLQDGLRMGEIMMPNIQSIRTGLIMAAAAGLFVSTVFAQNATKVVITGDAAKRAQTKEEIALVPAQKIVETILDCAKQHKVLMAAFVLAPNGSIVTSGRMDGQSPGNIEYAMKRAETVIRWHEDFHSTRDLYNQGEGVGDLTRTIRFYSQGGYPVPGGLSIIADDVFIGAVGVGGSVQWDEYCGYDAITKVVGTQPPAAKVLPAPTEYKPTPSRFPPPPQPGQPLLQP